MNLLWIGTALLLYAEKTQSQGIFEIQDYNEFLTIT